MCNPWADSIPNHGSPEAMEALSKELATAGETIPNRIPVSMAMARLEQEFVDAKLPAIRLYREDQSPGDEILRRVSSIRTGHARVLMQSQHVA